MASSSPRITTAYYTIQYTIDIAESTSLNSYYIFINYHPYTEYSYIYNASYYIYVNDLNERLFIVYKVYLISLNCKLIIMLTYFNYLNNNTEQDLKHQKDSFMAKISRMVNLLRLLKEWEMVCK